MEKLKKIIEQANELERQRNNLESELRSNYFMPILHMEDSQEKMDKAIEFLECLGLGVSYLRFQCRDLVSDLEDKGYDKSLYILKVLENE